MELIKKILTSLKRHKFLLLVFIFLVFFSLVIARRHDAITNPQFWAEDGVFWYQEAYSSSNSIQPFFVPKQKYFQTISRIGAAISLFFDINKAPFVFNTVAIIIQILPALYFLSARFKHIVPRLYQRFGLGLIYLMLPGTIETHANLTNAQWRLALLMFMIIVAIPSKKNWWKIFDGLSLAIAGLSGPFVFFAFPIALVNAYFKSSREKLSQLIILGIAFVIQSYSFLFIVVSDAIRSEAPLGISFDSFFKILAGHVFTVGIFGINNYKIISHWHIWENGFIPFVVSIVGIIILSYVFWKSKIELRLFLIFSFLIFGASLITPQASIDKPQWEILTKADSCGRYYFFPTIAWVFSLFWILMEGKSKILKYITGVLILCLIFMGIPNDFIFKPYKDYKFQEQTREFKQLMSGEMYTFKINPSWKMTLQKK